MPLTPLPRWPEDLAAWSATPLRERLDQLMRSPARKPLLDGIFWQMPKQLDPRQAQGVNTSIRWCLTGRTDGGTDVYQLELADGRPGCIRGDDGPDPRLTVTLDAVDFLRLVSGNLDPMQAYFKGQIALAGDIMVAAKLATLFRMPGRWAGPAGESRPATAATDPAEPACPAGLIPYAGQVSGITPAIELRSVIKRFGDDPGRRRARPDRARRRLLRPARAQRRRQVHHDADADRSDAAPTRARSRCSASASPRESKAGTDGDGGRAPARQPRRRADLPPDPRRCSRASTGSPAPQRPAAVDRALSIANLQARADTIVRDLSGGMRRRLLVARGLIHSPQLVLLDEPTVGLDPQVRQELWSLIDGLSAARA